MPRTRPPSEMALLRYQIISAYLAMDPPRGQRGTLLKELASRTWTLPDGRELSFAAETLRGWIRAFRRDGLSALEDAPRPTPGVQILDDDVQALLCRLKRDVPARSVDRDRGGDRPGQEGSAEALHRAPRAAGPRPVWT